MNVGLLFLLEDVFSKRTADQKDYLRGPREGVELYFTWQLEETRVVGTIPTDPKKPRVSRAAQGWWGKTPSDRIPKSLNGADDYRIPSGDQDNYLIRTDVRTEIPEEGIGVSYQLIVHWWEKDNEADTTKVKSAFSNNTLTKLLVAANRNASTNDLEEIVKTGAEAATKIGLVGSEVGLVIGSLVTLVAKVAQKIKGEDDYFDDTKLELAFKKENETLKWRIYPVQLFGTGHEGEWLDVGDDKTLEVNVTHGNNEVGGHFICRISV